MRKENKMPEKNELNTPYNESKLLSLWVECAKECGIEKKRLLEIIDSVYGDTGNSESCRSLTEKS